MPDLPLRLGYHGATAPVTGLIRSAGPAGRSVVLREYDVADPFGLLRAGALDLMVAKFTVREPDLAVSRTLAVDPRAALVGAGHPLAGRPSLVLDDLADLDGFQCPGAMPPYVWDQVVPPVTPSGRPLHRRYAVGSVAEMMALVGAGRAVHVSLGSLAEVAPPDVRVIPIRDLPAAPVFLTWVRDALPEHGGRFVAAAERAARAAR